MASQLWVYAAELEKKYLRKQVFFFFFSFGLSSEIVFEAQLKPYNIE